jgi:hypothetical protein
MRRIAVAAWLSLTFALPTLLAQSTRLGWPADPNAGSDDVLVLCQFSVADRKGYGTLPLTHLHAVRLRLDGLAELAILEKAGTSPSVHPAAAFAAEGRLRASEVTINALRLLSLRPVLGRDFTADDERARHRVAILTHGAWLRHFAGRPDAVGSVGWRRSESGGREDVVIVGVLPRDAPARAPELDPDAEILVLAPPAFDLRSVERRAFAPILRPAAGVTARQLQTRLDETSAALGATDPEASRFAFRLESLRRPARRERN